MLEKRFHLQQGKGLKLYNANPPRKITKIQKMDKKVIKNKDKTTRPSQKLRETMHENNWSPRGDICSPEIIITLMDYVQTL